MRTTIDLPDDLHRIISSLAMHRRRSMNVTAAELIRRGLTAMEMQSPSGRDAARKLALDPLTGLPAARLTRTVTPEGIQALDDEA
jgi:hypothetical protein